MRAELTQTCQNQRKRAVAQLTFETLLYAVEDGVATVTLNRPEKLNAFNTQMMKDMIAAFDATDGDDAVRAVIVTGAGRGFCAGADIAEVFNAQLEGDAAAATPTRDWVEVVRSCKPIVAAVNGPVIGIGLTMILSFDRIVVAEGAKLSVRFVKMGVVPELASSMYLPMRCGWGAASDPVSYTHLTLPTKRIV